MSIILWLHTILAKISKFPTCESPRWSKWGWDSDNPSVSAGPPETPSAESAVSATFVIAKRPRRTGELTGLLHVDVSDAVKVNSCMNQNEMAEYYIKEYILLLVNVKEQRCHLKVLRGASTKC